VLLAKQELAIGQAELLLAAINYLKGLAIGPLGTNRDRDTLREHRSYQKTRETQAVSVTAIRSRLVRDSLQCKWTLNSVCRLMCCDRHIFIGLTDSASRKPQEAVVACKNNTVRQGHC
jgi:hypothetical protein